MSALRILLVEDEFLVRDMAAETLRDRGFDVLEAETGDKAAELLVTPDGVDVLYAGRDVLRDPLRDRRALEKVGAA